MQLKEFLQTASTDHAQAFAEARAFTVNAGRKIAKHKILGNKQLQMQPEKH